MSEVVRIKRLREGAKLPHRGTSAASGYDIHACLEDGPVVVGQRPVLIPTGLAFEVPEGLDAQLRPRSGLARQGVLSTFGTLDADYRGELIITLYTTSPEIQYTVEDGDRIAQLVIARLADVCFRGGGGTERDRAGLRRTWEHGPVTYAYIIAGAIAGAPLRYFIGSRVQSALGGDFPWGTLAVNVSGCLVIGVLLGLAETRDILSREARLLLVTGFLGSFTTFSAFGWETYSLARADDMARAGANILASVVIGLVAVWAGASLAKLA